MDNAVNWTPAERLFYETARSIYWEDLFQLIMLASDNIVRANIIDEDKTFQKNYQREYTEFVKNYM